MEQQFRDVGKAFRLVWPIYQKLSWEWWNSRREAEITGSLIVTTLYHIVWDCCSHFIVNTLPLIMEAFYAWMKMYKKKTAFLNHVE